MRYEKLSRWQLNQVAERQIRIQPVDGVSIDRFRRDYEVQTQGLSYETESESGPTCLL